MQTGKLDIVKDNIDNIYAYVDHLASTPMSYKNGNGDKKEDARLTGETGTLCDHLSRIPIRQKAIVRQLQLQEKHGMSFSLIRTLEKQRTLRARFKIHRLLMQLLFVSMW